MKNFIEQIASQAIEILFSVKPESNQIQVNETRKEFQGDFTLVCFPLLKISKMGPEQTGAAIGRYLVEHCAEVSDFNVVKGFLNISLNDSVWVKSFASFSADQIVGEAFGSAVKNIMVEYSSPNTNKPLHLGHLRNNFLGYSVSEILKAVGHGIQKVQIINDRGIHICKSMLAWQKFGNGETPESSGLKGDKLVGKYYVAFDKEYKLQINALVADGLTTEEAEKKAPIILEAQEMLRKWEAGDEAVVALWKTMNHWVYSGFNATYQTMGVDFDTLYYESDTYLLGKKVVQEGLEKGIFYQKPDGSVWVDLTDDGLDEKLLMRGDGTTVYMTQDIGTAILRYQDWPVLNQIIYTVGNEQDYHFKVLFLILKKLGYSFADSCYHLSYGMVDLPSGKMKSREGTVVDADELMADMVQQAKITTEELGKLPEMPSAEKDELYYTIGMGALKYFLLRVDPKKRMLFNPEESIDFNGNTGPFIQYTYARISSLLSKSEFDLASIEFTVAQLHEKEKVVIKQLLNYGEALQTAAAEYNPAVVAAYAYELVKLYNGLYQSLPILKEENKDLLKLRLVISQKTGSTIKHAMSLLGIRVPERM
ncbi:MAG: arginine--tRNA ligase [Luteibaculaceae bacterium]